MKSQIAIATLVFAVTFSVGCNKDENAADIQELGQQIGDVMASVDESGGSSGNLASVMNANSKMMARLAPPSILERLNPLPRANAAACYLTSTFGSCTNNVITRDFADCTLGAATFSGTVSLTFVDDSVNSDCQITEDNHSITRVPSFTVTGRRGATLTVSKTATVGQKITRTSAGVFTFTNDGIRRKFDLPGGGTLLDYTSQTTSAITISGATRASRTMTGGALQVTNNLTDNVCTFVPQCRYLGWNL